MHRRFREHMLRDVTDLAGVWDFAWLGEAEAEETDPASIRFDDVMAVPGCFDATPAYASRRGLAAYRTCVPVEHGVRYRLVLDAVHHWSRVFVDRRALRDHVGGYTPFHVDFVAAGETAEILVLVDNRLDYDRCPIHLDYFDWYHYGGIARGAELHRLGDLWIEDVTVTTEQLDPPAISVAVSYGAAEGASPSELSVRCGDVKESRTVTPQEPAGSESFRLELPGAGLWSPDEPNLHMLEVLLGCDDRRERFGIRTVEAAGREIRINGQAVTLLGFNRHEAHPQFGPALPQSLLVSDAQQVRALNANFIRGSHYPQDVRFLDLCDELGICVWNESIGWQHTAEQLNDPKFLDAQVLNVEEMVTSAKNRPSVILWGILNESHSEDPACRDGYEKLLGRIRELDPTRPVTYACNHWKDDVLMDLADVVSINCYPGWYGTEIESIPETLDAAVTRFEEAGHGDKPVIISEIGAGALYGWRDAHETRWTEQYQVRLLETVIGHMFEASERFCGLAIWQFGDCRTSHQVGKAIGRPRAFNNKGVVDEYRRPKQAFGAVSQLYGRIAGNRQDGP